jgi:single-strand DNA-binding protein
MKNIDIVLFDGNLTQDPEARIVGNNKRLTTFTVAINHPSSSEDRDGVSYIPVETWGKLAENCAKYLVKGSRVTVEGALRQERWQDDQGKNHSRIKILARNVRFDTARKHEAA